MLQDRRGGSGKLLNLLRVNNDLFCDLAALATFDDIVEKAHNLDTGFIVLAHDLYQQSVDASCSIIYLSWRYSNDSHVVGRRLYSS